VEPSLAERTKSSQILSGDFNIDFSTEKSKPLIDFLKTALNLNDPKESTTKYVTKIVFLRNINRLNKKRFK
jgi:hypothetical protein